MTRRVHLERPSAHRREEFLGSLTRSRRLHRHFADPPRDRRAYDAWLGQVRQPTHQGNFVIDDLTRALVGVVNVNEIVRGGFESGYLGYYAFEPHAGRGFMRAGLQLVINRAFRKLGLHRLEANIQPDNGASIELVSRLGFKREGFSPRYLKLRGRWRDHERWALLREHWREG